ncbi:polysaccharide deacetylase family protein [Gelidibacter japonicus]|uniref:polysaccharide deacetylase family protein n=1 Tax=Gelidibacter japonicus TaxID=1962232 RepID=UPI002021179E|nr:polysaccharide deacetylase family protein [Gelidibacter japonicus]MCL8008458.1 polysaccharide deacetylase family protein [Gelidibacter japonicus]
MLLVYTHKITPRLTYAFRHISLRVLNVPVSFTTTVEEFIAHDSMKISYTKQPLSSELFIRSHELLFEQGLSDLDIHVQDWGHTKCFFSTSDKSSMPFDIFAATFYLLSRYEEYLPHVKDEYGRFLATESLAFNEGFLHQPVVDIWAYKFKAILQEQFPDFEFPIKKYNIQPVIDVPVAYYFKEKGLLRTFGGAVNDLFRLKLKQFYRRFQSLAGFKRDPYDTFKWIITKQKQNPNKFIVFFLIGEYSTYDKNININKKRFVSLIKYVADYCKVGLKVSFLALDDKEMLKKEKRTLESTTNHPLEASRHSFSKLNLPESYRNLIELEIKQDFTMGYINHMGFRAGTCTPFHFYDLDYEVQTPLQINPFHCVDYALLKRHSLLDKKEDILRIIREVKNVNGTFVPIFHNYSFSDMDRWKGFRELFRMVLESEHED